jgi:hypothetical protein
MHGTENHTTETLKAREGEKGEQKQVGTEEECSYEGWIRATERVAKRIGTEASLLRSVMFSSPYSSICCNDSRRYTQAELRELIEKEGSFLEI